MGGGIGKMFGVDKIFGGILDSIGLGALKPLVSGAFDFATGNIPGLLQDLTGLMSSFGDGGFANNVANQPPLPTPFSSNSPADSENYDSGSADQSNGANNTTPVSNNNSDLSSNRLGQLFKLLGDIFSSKDPSEMKDKITQLFKLLSDNADNRQSVQNARTTVQFFSGGITINS